MEATALENDTRTSAAAQTADPVNIQNEERAAANEKHQERQRSFPAINEIVAGDRFTIQSGSQVYSGVISSSILLTEDVKVEIQSVASSSPDGQNNTFHVMALKKEGGSWKFDDKLGRMVAEYGALSAWHPKRKA